MFVLGAPTVGTIVRRTLVLMHNQGIRAVRPHCGNGTNQGLVQALGEGLVRTALWAVRSTGRWSGRGWPCGGGPRSTSCGPSQHSQFRNWHKADLPAPLLNVRC